MVEYRVQPTGWDPTLRIQGRGGEEEGEARSLVQVCSFGVKCP